MFSLILYFVLSVYMIDSENTTTKCEYYNKTVCAQSTEKCETERIQTCEEDSINACYAVWSNGTNGTITVVFKGCFSSERPCNRGFQCIDDRDASIRKNMFTCCCEGDMCNTDIFWSPNSESLLPAPNSYEIPREFNTIVLMVSLPLIIICILTIVIVHRRHKQLYLEQKADSEEDTRCNSSPHRLRPIQLNEVKARGRFGTVWKGDFKGQEVAVKIMAVQHKQSWLTEQDIFKIPLMNHSNILHFIGAEERGGDFQTEYWLITAYHNNGSLCDYLRANFITWEQLCHIAYTMTRGLNHLHEMYSDSGLHKPSIAHRDFKSSNVLLKDDLTACIADFGLAIIFKNEEPDESVRAYQVGTARYMPPEMLAGAVNFSRDYFLRIDMYSCGLVLWELLSRCSSHGDPIREYKLPYEEELGQHPALNDLKDFVVEEKKRPIIKEIWKSHVGLSSFCDTIKECWDHDVESRLSASCVMQRIAWYVPSNDCPHTGILID